MKLYIVTACSGEYDDYWEELIRAFSSEYRALSCIEKLSKWIDALRAVEQYDWDEVDYDDDLAVQQATLEETAQWDHAMIKHDVPGWAQPHVRYWSKSSDSMWYRLKEVEYEV